ncbi:MAG: CDP-glycerol glycerophosphotransferase family protein [Arcobacteraceae bacterium]|nr:CDP-glycerol glycerophosphotransferase family protein [Arcobacteraceae bacterium]MDY0327531.1 CDP-glycerol glycerophosphotransferase family protein [Arcobacteraceae bacterium]
MNFIDIQEHYKIVLEEKIKKIKNGSKIKVAFFISQQQLWCGKTVYNELQKSEYFEPIIVAFPNLENKIENKIKTCTDNYNFFNNQSMNVIFGYDIEKDEFYNYEKVKADIVFFDQPYPRLPEELRWPKIYKESLVCYIPYGYKVGNLKQDHFNMELHNSCWTIFAESLWHKEQFIQYGPLGGKNVVVSGYPKFDEYNDKEIKKCNIWKIPKHKPYNIIKKVIWAPHWTVGENILNYSTFDKYYKFFLELATKNKDISWVLKPHQRLKHYITEIGFMSEQEANSYFNTWNNLDNSIYYNDSNYMDIFKTSDALITDCGSFLAEYLPTKKPIIHLINEKSVGYNELGEKLTDSYYKIYNVEDLETTINNVILSENDYLKDTRLSNLYIVIPNSSGAGKYIVDYFIDKLVK